MTTYIYIYIYIYVEFMVTATNVDINQWEDIEIVNLF